MEIVPEPLSAKHQGSFAYKTVKDRLPVILTKVVDTIFRKRREAYNAHGEQGADDVKSIISVLSELRYRMTTDKPLLPLSGDDCAVWNDYLEQNKREDATELSWFSCSWLLAECYLYRRIMEPFAKSKYFRDCDPFQYQKEQAFIGHVAEMDVIANSLLAVIKHETVDSEATQKNALINFMKLSLWANRFDLSISAGEHSQKNPLEDVMTLDNNILVNDVEYVAEFLFRNRPAARIDIMLDNAGFELFCDLCLAELLLCLNLASKVYLHAKIIPWFVSDVTFRDCMWTLELLRASERPCLSQLAYEWHNKLESGQFVLKAHKFWTFPHPYSKMKSIAPDFYHGLSKSELLIFKGDLHYRKLTGDLQWNETTPFREALCGFLPANIVALRTLKAETVVGLKDGQSEEVKKIKSDWLTSGEFAVVQYALKSHS